LELDYEFNYLGQNSIKQEQKNHSEQKSIKLNMLSFTISNKVRHSTRDHQRSETIKPSIAFLGVFEAKVNAKNRLPPLPDFFVL